MATRTQSAQPRRSRDVAGSLATPDKKAIPGDGILVRATARGFYAGNPISVGQEFTIANLKELGSWMERIEGGAKPKAKPAPAGEGAETRAESRPDDPLGAGE